MTYQHLSYDLELGNSIWKKLQARFPYVQDGDECAEINRWVAL